MAKKLLTPEDKVYLDRVTRYLGSLGMSRGYIEFEYEGDFSSGDLRWDQITHFDNNYSADIPHGLYPILKKVMEYILDNDLVPYPDVNDVNWQRVEIILDCEERTLTVNQYYSYYDTADGSQTEWTPEDDEEIFQQLKDEDVIGELSDTELELKFNGSGDSGYIESSFENGDSVPSVIEDWCYNRLEGLHGGWEINEGSQGSFTFDLEKETIVLDFTYNTEETSTNTIWEEKF